MEDVIIRSFKNLPILQGLAGLESLQFQEQDSAREKWISQITMAHNVSQPRQPPHMVQLFNDAGQTLIRAAYRSGDRDFLALLNANAAPEQYAQTLNKSMIERNMHWMLELERILQKQNTPTLVMVGCFHLYGPGGLRQLCKQKGWTVEPCDTSFPWPHMDWNHPDVAPKLKRALPVYMESLRQRHLLAR